MITLQQLTTCDQEPIHSLSRVQQNGVLFVLNYDTLQILQISENCKDLTDTPAEAMLNKYLGDFFHPQFITNIRNTISTLSFHNINLGTLCEGNNQKKIFCVLHKEEHYLILEIDHSEHLEESQIVSEDIVDKAIETFEAHETLEELAYSIAKSVHTISQFDRVMVYQFDEHFNGRVIAQVNHELKENYIGHHFPASDIPSQARELYLKNTFRIIENVEDIGSVIIPTLNPITQQPLDMSFCYCRSVSAVHLEYLKNMGVEASMSISIVIDGKLWGLIACHHPKVKKIPLQLYAAYYLLSKTYSFLIEQKQYLIHYQRSFELRTKREVYLQMLESKKETNFVRAFGEEMHSLSNVILCDGVTLYYDKEFVSNTDIFSPNELLELLTIVKENIDNNYFESSRLLIEYPDFEKISTLIGGVLAVSIPNLQNCYLLFIRYEQTKVITWAGEPKKQIRYENGVQIIEPRASFESWKEVVVGTSKPFSAEEIESAILLVDRLSFIHGKFRLVNETSQLKEIQSIQEKLLHNYQNEQHILRERDILLEAIGEGVYGIDINGICYFINLSACSLLGFSKDEIIGQKTHELFHHHRIDGSEFPLHECITHTALTQNKQVEHKDWLIKKNGEMLPVRIIATPIHKDGNITGAVIAFSDITVEYNAECRLKELNVKLQHEAITDPLTQLYNRRYFQEYGNLQFNRCRKDNLSLSLIAIDIDHFKSINDTYGHEYGDKVLIDVSQITKSNLRDGDILARVGGEEFTIILPESSIKRTFEIAERIRHSIDDNVFIMDQKNIHCTISLGITCLTDLDTNFLDLLRRADENLYKAKENGRNIVYSDRERR